MTVGVQDVYFKTGRPVVADVVEGRLGVDTLPLGACGLDKRETKVQVDPWVVLWDGWLGFLRGGWWDSSYMTPQGHLLAGLTTPMVLSPLICPPSWHYVKIPIRHLGHIASTV